MRDRAVGNRSLDMITYILRKSDLKGLSAREGRSPTYPPNPRIEAPPDVISLL
jgi:hypothetical protein